MLGLIKFLSAFFRLKMILLMSCDQNDNLVSEISRLQNVAFGIHNISSISSVNLILSCDTLMPSNSLLDAAKEWPLLLPFGVDLNSSHLRFDSQVYLYDIKEGGIAKLWQAFSIQNGSPIVQEIGRFDWTHPSYSSHRSRNFPISRSLRGITLRYEVIMPFFHICLFMY